MVSPKTNFYLWDKIANNNQDVGGIGILGTNNVSNFDDAFRELMAQLATAFGSNLLSIAGALNGLTMSNNVGDSVNDLDIAVGSAASDAASPIIMTLASILTKRLDAAWAVGTNQGGLDTGTIANATYHVFLVQRSDTGVVDALFSLSPTGPTMPASYDRKRRIGSIRRDSATIRQFTQVGDDFTWGAGIGAYSTNNPGTAAVLVDTFTPTGLIYKAKFVCTITNGASAVGPVGWISTPNLADTAPSSSFANIGSSTSAGGGQLIAGSSFEMLTNTSSQVRVRISASDVNVTVRLSAYGFIDTRGRI